MNNAPIGVFDSGVGGISTLKKCMQLLPGESFVYLADRSGLPYGEKTDEQISARALACAETLVKEGVKAIVIACNTATNVAASVLRERLSIPIVGLEPAIKPAAESCKKGSILVLTTPATASKTKFLSLLSSFDNGRIIVAPQPNLASEVEEHIDDIDELKGRVHSILSHFRNVEGVVLGCTHYVFLRGLIADFYGGRIKIFDGNEGAARHLKNILEDGDMAADSPTRSIKFLVV